MWQHQNIRPKDSFSSTLSTCTLVKFSCVKICNEGTSYDPWKHEILTLRSKTIVQRGSYLDNLCVWRNHELAFSWGNQLETLACLLHKNKFKAWILQIFLFRTCYLVQYLYVSFMNPDVSISTCSLNGIVHIKSIWVWHTPLYFRYITSLRSDQSFHRWKTWKQWHCEQQNNVLLLF